MLSPGSMDPTLSATMGNLQNPAYVPTVLDDYPRPFSFINRLKNMIFSVLISIKWNGSAQDQVEVEVRARMFIYYSVIHSLNYIVHCFFRI